ncbi:MAG: O-antigen ligase family protein [Planctomycetales bacterium]|nr:O-antigen ligase family protein [Planctomycetales bacterium]
MTLVAILFALASLVWMIPLLRSGRYIQLATLVLALGTFFGPDFYAIDGPIQISIDRVLFFVLVALAFVGLRLEMTKLPEFNRLDWLVIAMVAWFGWSAMTGGSNPPGTPPMARWIFYIAMPAAMYFIPRMVSIKTCDVRWILTGSIVMGIYLSVTAVFEIKGLHGFVFPRYIVNPDNWEFFGRGRGPLMNPSGNGILISMGLTAAAIGLIKSRRERRLFYSVVVACLLVGVYATLTRSAWMGGIAAIGIVGFVHSPRWVRVMSLGVAVLIVGIASTSLKDKIFRLKRDENLSAADSEKSVKLRPLLAIVAWEMFKDRPITGHGYGHYEIKHRTYHDDRGYKMPLGQARPYTQHNVFLSILVDTGIIGLVLFSAWFLSTAAIAWKLSRDGSACQESRSVGLVMMGTMLAYLCNGMFQDATIIPMVHMFLFFGVGVTVTTMQSGVATDSAGQRVANHRRQSGTVAADPARA